MSPLEYADWVKAVHNCLSFVETELGQPWVRRIKDGPRRQRLYALYAGAHALRVKAEGVKED